MNSRINNGATMSEKSIAKVSAKKKATKNISVEQRLLMPPKTKPRYSSAYPVLQFTNLPTKKEVIRYIFEFEYAEK
jgi:hypothetical protein